MSTSSSSDEDFSSSSDSDSEESYKMMQMNMLYFSQNEVKQTKYCSILMFLVHACMSWHKSKMICLQALGPLSVKLITLNELDSYYPDALYSLAYFNEKHVSLLMSSRSCWGGGLPASSVGFSCSRLRFGQLLENLSSCSNPVFATLMANLVVWVLFLFVIWSFAGCTLLNACSLLNISTVTP